MTPHGSTLRLVPTPEALADAAAREVMSLLDAAIAWRGEAHLVLSGGRTPAAMHRVLTTLPFEGWPFVHVWFGDERTVPSDHTDSNYRMARETLLAHVPIPASQVHRFETERRPADAALTYDAELQALASRQGREVPTMDVLLLGMGADAHTASLFPGSPVLDDVASDGDGAFARAVFVPSMDTWRLTMTPAVIRGARAVLLLVAGADKRAALARAFESDVSLAEAPVTVVHEAAGDVAWFVDRAALFG